MKNKKKRTWISKFKVTPETKKQIIEIVKYTVHTAAEMYNGRKEVL